MKKIALILTLFLITATVCVPLTSYAENTRTYTYFTTPFGVDVEIGYLNIPDQIQDHPNASHYISATKIGNGTMKYNCYTYALFYQGEVNFISNASASELFTVSQPQKYLHTLNPCFTEVLSSQVQVGDVVMYKQIFSNTVNDGAFAEQYIHSGIIVEKGSGITDTVINSKWGNYAIYRHNIKDDPYGDGAVIEGMATNPPIVKTLRLQFFRFSHTYTYSETPAAGTLALPPSISVCHKATCTSCGISHYEAHNYIREGNYMVCSGCRYVFPTPVNNNGDILQ